MKRPPQVITIDFETEAIEDRSTSRYPPKPVGVSILWPGKSPHYFAWGHDSANNCEKHDAELALIEAWRSPLPLLFHNAKFDVEVAEAHMNLPFPVDRANDTMLLLFLDDPHAKSLALKPSAERLLGLPPEERDAVRDWLVAHKFCRADSKDWGKYIARAPGSLVGPYCNGDVTRTLKLFKLLYPQIHERGMLPSYERKMKLMHMLLRSEQHGILIDVPRLESDIDVYQDSMALVEKWLRKRLQAPNLCLTNDNELADALENSGVVTDFVLTEKSGQRSVSKVNLTPGMFTDPRVAHALGYFNRLSTSLGTFMQTWLKLAQDGDGRVHTSWNQTRQEGSGGFAGTRTGRLSSSRPNFLNVPKNWYDKGDGYVHPKHLKSLPELPNLRAYYLPEKGQVWGHRDFNQQELRVAAHFEGGALMDAYNNPDPPIEMCDRDGNIDIHLFVKHEITRLTNRELERRAVKVLNFGMLYGQGVGLLAEKLGCSVDEAKTVKKAQRAALPGIKGLEDGIRALVKQGLPVVTWDGREYFVEEPVLIHNRLQTFEYKLLNYLIQGSASGITEQALLNYDATRQDSEFLVTVYDEINISSPKRALKKEMQILRDAMEGVELDVHMRSDAKAGPTWGDLEKFKEPK